MRGPPLARRIAANIAKLPEPLIKTQKFTPSIGSSRCSIAARQTYRLDKSKLRQSRRRSARPRGQHGSAGHHSRYADGPQIRPQTTVSTYPCLPSAGGARLLPPPVAARLAKRKHFPQTARDFLFTAPIRQIGK